MLNLLKNKIFLVSVILLAIGTAWLVLSGKSVPKLKTISQQAQPTPSPNPLAIAGMRAKNYPGSQITIEQTLPPTATYDQFVASYKSDGLKIYALLTVPKGEKPKNGWPVILFNHGYIPPDVYRTTERYIAYVDALARNGYIVFKPDYRGNGASEGQPEGAYYSPAYTTDDLNALASVKNYKDADPNKIGVWGHSMGGNITLRDLVVRPNDIKAAVIWGGVVGSYEDLMYNWQRRVPFVPSARELSLRNRSRSELVAKYGDPKSNPAFWQTIDPTSYVADIKAPVQLHASTTDEEVPAEFSQNLYQKLQTQGKISEIFTYPGGDHNISSPNFELAMERTIAFFDKYLKGN